MTAVRLSEEFGFELVLQHCTEGYRIAENWHDAASGVADPDRQPRRQARGDGACSRRNAAILSKAGVKVAINTTTLSPSRDSCCAPGPLPCAAVSPKIWPLKALTLHGAQMLHLEGTLRLAGKGQGTPISSCCPAAPFSVYTRCCKHTSRAKRVFDRTLHAD